MFKPEKRIDDKDIRNIRLTFSSESYDLIKLIAKEKKISMRDLCTQAVFYALENMEVENDKQ
jgi:hypothetical protein